MKRNFVLAGLLLAHFFSAAQTNADVLVYALTGKVYRVAGKNKVLLKSYDRLNAQTTLYLDKNARLFCISPQKRMLVYQKSGPATIRQVLAAQNEAVGEMGKAMELIVHHFIEHGKALEKERDFSRVGSAFRGNDDRLLLFPFTVLKVWRETRFTPVFNPDLPDAGLPASLAFIRNETVLSSSELKAGDVVSLKKAGTGPDPLYLRFSRGKLSQVVEVAVADEEDGRVLDAALENLRKQFGTDTGEAYLLSAALYFEQAGYVLEALRCYDELIRIQPSDKGIARLRASCISGIQ